MFILYYNYYFNIEIMKGKIHDKRNYKITWKLEFGQVN